MLSNWQLSCCTICCREIGGRSLFYMLSCGSSGLYELFLPQAMSLLCWCLLSQSDLSGFKSPILELLLKFHSLGCTLILCNLPTTTPDFFKNSLSWKHFFTCLPKCVKNSLWHEGPQTTWSDISGSSMYTFLLLRLPYCFHAMLEKIVRKFNM